MCVARYLKLHGSVMAGWADLVRRSFFFFIEGKYDPVVWGEDVWDCSWLVGAGIIHSHIATSIARDPGFYWSRTLAGEDVNSLEGGESPKAAAVTSEREREKRRSFLAIEATILKK
jgi:hypothetical protein